MGIEMSDDPLTAEAFFSKPITDFVKAIPQLIEDIATDATSSDDMDTDKLIRSVWQNWILGGHQYSDVTNEEILEAGLSECSHAEVSQTLQRLGIHLTSDPHGIIHVG